VGVDFTKPAAERIGDSVRVTESLPIDRRSGRQSARMYRKNLSACYIGDSDTNISGNGPGTPSILSITEATVSVAPIYTRTGNVVQIKKRPGVGYFLIAQCGFRITGTDVRAEVGMGIFRDPLGALSLVEGVSVFTELQKFEIITTLATFEIGPEADSLATSTSTLT